MFLLFSFFPFFLKNISFNAFLQSVGLLELHQDLAGDNITAFQQLVPGEMRAWSQSACLETVPTRVLKCL